MSKQNRILTAVLAFQIVVLAVVFWPKASVARGERMFGELEAEQIVRITIHGADDQRVQLARGADGWVLPDADGFPVQEDRVLSLLDKIADLRTDRLVTRTSASHKRLQVADDDFQRLIEFEQEDGTRHKLYLGSSPRYQVLHVRAEDDDAVYLALGLLTSDAGASISTWIDTSYFSAPSDQIAALTLENQNGRFRFEKDDAGDWTMIDLQADESLLQNNVESLVTRVSSLRMLRPLGREEKALYGFDDPSAVVTLQTRDEEGNEKTHIVRIGRALEEEEGFVAKSATSPYYVLMADYTVRDLIEKTRQDFLEAPPEPMPTPEAPAEPTPTP